MRSNVRRYRPRLLCSLLLLVGANALAHEGPTPQQLAEWQASPEFAERTERIRRLKMYEIGAGLGEKAAYKLRKAGLQASGLSPAEISDRLFGGRNMAFPYSARPELRSVGRVRTLTVLVDFKDHRASNDLPGMTVDGIRTNIYGDGTPAAAPFQPYDSLHRYYARASQGKVDVQGEVLGWYSFPQNRSQYEPSGSGGVQENRALFKMVREALQSFDDGHDFAQYDNDSDGDVDLVTIMYAGPDNGWGGFWWAYRWEFFVPEASQTTFDGKRLKQFVFQFVSRRAGSDFDPTTLMHEMGHAFGLADYYDYDPSTGPAGGVGGLDMMDANRGNHNAFSRWLLDWIEPQVLGGGAPASRTWNASGSIDSTDKAIAIFPNLSRQDAPEQEMFILENRTRTGNDGGSNGTPSDGLLIWRVDAAPNASGDGFALDNSYTPRKLIQLVRADSADDFVDGEGATAAVYFRPGKEFSPRSVPNSDSHDGTPTGIVVDQIAINGERISARVGFESPAPVALAADGAPAPQSAAPASATPAVSSKTQAVDVEHIERLAAELQTLTPQALAAKWDRARSDYRPGEASRQAEVELQLILANWAGKDGPAAVAAAASLPDQQLAQEAFPRALEAWARHDPQQASAWYLNAAQESLRTSGPLSSGNAFTRTVFQWQAANDPQAAIESLDRLERTPEIWGALEGIDESRTFGGYKQDFIDLQINKLDHRVKIGDVRRLQQSVRKVERRLDDPQERSETRRLIQQRIDGSNR